MTKDAVRRRKPDEDRRSVVIVVRATVAERRAIGKRAHAAGMSVSAWLRWRGTEGRVR